jgi:hypothetical protein
VTVYYSLGDSSVVVLALRREGKGLKPPLNLSSTTKKQVTRTNPDPKLVPEVSDPEKLLRKSKGTQGQSSSSKDNSPTVEVVPEIETKPIVQSLVVYFPSTIYELKTNKHLIYRGSFERFYQRY